MYAGYHFLLLTLLALQAVAKPLNSHSARVNKRETPSASCYSAHRNKNKNSQVAGRTYHGEATTWKFDTSIICICDYHRRTLAGLPEIVYSKSGPNRKDWVQSLWLRTSGTLRVSAVLAFRLLDQSGLTKESEIVPCNFSTPIEFINKDGVSKDWNSIQVAGAEVPIRSLEVMPIANESSGGTGQRSWIRLTKQSNSNYFQPESGKGLGKSADIKVTCDNGKKIITKNVELDKPLNITDAVGNC
ncbi:hypothetical protein PGT21_007853 [Puccinia graminis f. sp. tritici]|uniref:Uncharacterized protein n=1 Tax=Puccinia graminis f. sp. tritici TaxID=56615 RepID=A0A5B0NVN9_PUCGR|nr:hypothetical protein PGT21_007853 [Puccinia graminis f. sp. tritici]